MTPPPKTPAALPVVLFKDAREWNAWLRQHHGESRGIWLKIAKKGSALGSVSYEEALEAALAFGWIDGQKKSRDSDSWLQRFTPRGPRSIWSRINREKAEALIQSGKMKPAGMRAVERARENGQWQRAYEGQRTIEIPPDLQRELDQRPDAADFFRALNSVNRYAILHRIQTAVKPETRSRRIHQFVEMLEKHKKLYP